MAIGMISGTVREKKFGAGRIKNPSSEVNAHADCIFQQCIWSLGAAPEYWPLSRNNRVGVATKIAQWLHTDNNQVYRRNGEMGSIHDPSLHLYEMDMLRQGEACLFNLE